MSVKTEGSMKSRLSTRIESLKLGFARLAEGEDAPEVYALMNTSMALNFRITCVEEVAYMLCNAVLSIVQLDDKDKIVGCLSLKDYPKIPSVHPCAWEDFLWTRYKVTELNARNCLFIHMMCWDEVYSRRVVDAMLKTVFMHDPYVMHIGMLKTLIDYPLLVPGQPRAEASFRKVQAIERGMSGDSLPPLVIADRAEVSPRLRIRKAVEEDNDDIVPIIERHSPRLQELYGEFYISELIARHPESDRVLLVCEHKELARGVMCLNTQINYSALEESFDLTPFSGLKKLDGKPEMRERCHDETDTSNISVSTSYLTMGGVASSHNPQVNVRTHLYSTYDPVNLDMDPDIKSYLEQMELMELWELEDDEDEEEFSIVNIGDELLTVPPMIFFEKISDADVVENVILAPTEELPEPAVPSKQKIKTLTKLHADPIRFTGEPNAFVIELCAMHEDYDERYAFDILEAAYDVFPDYDYCIICVPTSHPPFPLLEHFTLVAPYQHRRNSKFVNEALYVAHRNSVRGDICLRLCEPADLPSFVFVLDRCPKKQYFMEVLARSFEKTHLITLVVLSEKQPVGVVVVGPLEDSTAVRTQYILDALPRRPLADGVILFGIISPTLEPHSRWFTRELIRISRFTTLFWSCPLFGRGEAHPNRNLMSLGAYMNPVRSRTGMKNITGISDVDLIYKDPSVPFALWITERPLTSLPKVCINNGIVVIGASRTGLAFIEALITGPSSSYLTFTNITLVSEHGLPLIHESFLPAEHCVPREGKFTDKYMKSVPFFYYVDIITAVVVGIDRKRQVIHFACGGSKNYDELVITCGQQFQHPSYLAESLAIWREIELGKPCDRVLINDPNYRPDKVPTPPRRSHNLMLINTVHNATQHLNRLQQLIEKDKEVQFYELSSECPIVVYGDCLECYCCMAALLELGIEAKHIVFVESFPSEDPFKLRVNCFNNDLVDDRVQKAVEDLGIKVYRQCHLDDLETIDGRTVALHIMSRFHYIRLPCYALFYYGRRSIDLNIFKAINECGLVYDGGLIIGPQFETNDPHVYAAGTCTKYSRRLYANRWNHGEYASENVGEALSRLFLHKFDPFYVCNKRAQAQSHQLFPKYTTSILTAKQSKSFFELPQYQRWEPVIKFSGPMIQAGILPGGLYYMKMRKAGVEVPMAVHNVLVRQGHTLITDVDGNYFRLQLNSFHCVEGLTCLSKKEFSVELFSQLYGKHEAFFNKLLTRFTMGRIADLYEYFVQPWMAVLYQDTFEQLMLNINERKISEVFDVVTGYCHGKGEDKTCDTECCKDEMCICTKSKMHYAIPSECGQKPLLHKQTHKLWKEINGEAVVITHLADYLDKFANTNPHYARLTVYDTSKSPAKYKRDSDGVKDCHPSM